MLAFSGLIENLPESTGMDLLIPFRLALQDGRMGRGGMGWDWMGWDGMEWDGTAKGWDGCTIVHRTILVINIL